MLKVKLKAKIFDQIFHVPCQKDKKCKVQGVAMSTTFQKGEEKFFADAKGEEKPFTHAIALSLE